MSSVSNFLVADLARRYDSALRHFLKGRASRDEVGELVNECYLRLLALKNPSAIRHPKAFLFTTARNLAADRKRRRVFEVTSTHFPADQDNIVGNEPRPDELASRDELLLHLESALAELPPFTASVFWKRKFEGHSADAIAKDLGVSTRTVQKHLASALFHLHQRLEVLFPGQCK
jgi:RNA polymerase sigma-70 factor (ECF subfamily)